MKISKSKQELARIISENGGWIGGEFYVMCGDGTVLSSSNKPFYDARHGWCCGGGFGDNRFVSVLVAKNWCHTILARAEYLHLYPAPEQSLSELCGKVTEENRHEQVWTNPPTIEQLAADHRNAKDYAERKQQEADAAKDDAEAKLAELVAAGAAIGLVLGISPVGPELVITDWRDLKVGDEAECLQININGDDYADERIGTIGLVSATEEPGRSGQAVKLKFNDDECFWVSGWRFIRRP